MGLSSHHFASLTTSLFVAFNLFRIARTLPPLSSISPCAYPQLFDVDCGIDDAQLRGRAHVCDVDHVISMSEGSIFIQVIVDKLDAIDDRNAQQSCICHGQAYTRSCWFKIAFAFLKTLHPVPTGVSDVYGREFCPINASLQQSAGVVDLSFSPHISSRDWVMHYGEQFARILRERWRLGSCDEDLIFLTVIRRPDPLLNKTFATKSPSPFVFVSYGSAIATRLDEAVQQASRRGLRPHDFDPIAASLRRANHNLDRGHHLITVIERLVDEVVAVLNVSAQDEAKQRAGKYWGHVPDWAMYTFVGCSLLCLAMMIGLCAMRSQVRRGGSQRSKGHGDGRRWKTGFVGDESGAYTQQQPGVNLMQMMIPVGRSTTANTVI